MPLLQTLQLSQRSIAATRPLAQTITVGLAGWKTKIGHSPIWTQTLNHAQAAGWIKGSSMTLDRQRLIDAVRQGVSVEVCFLLDMLWGYGTGKGRGRAAVLKMLQDPGLIPNLTAGRTEVAAGNDQAAFAAYISIAGMGMSFVTKLLYFESRAIHPASYLPIFDDRVAQKLFRLALDPADTWLCAALLHGRGGDWASYDTYVRSVRHLAQQLSPPVDLEQLEYWLFL